MLQKYISLLQIKGEIGIIITVRYVLAHEELVFIELSSRYVVLECI